MLLVVVRSALDSVICSADSPGCHAEILSQVFSSCDSEPPLTSGLLVCRCGSHSGIVRLSPGQMFLAVVMVPSSHIVQFALYSS